MILDQLNDQETLNAYYKLLFGENYVRGFGRFILQDCGNELNMMVGVCNDLRSDYTKKSSYIHELVECEIIIKPLRKFAGNEHTGAGAAGLLRSGLDPSTYDVQFYP